MQQLSLATKVVVDFSSKWNDRKHTYLRVKLADRLFSFIFQKPAKHQFLTGRESAVLSDLRGMFRNPRGFFSTLNEVYFVEGRAEDYVILLADDHGSDTEYLIRGSDHLFSGAYRDSNCSYISADGSLRFL